ncbi:MAG: hypothetical protein HONBIEJF_00978 [Fimbriimonadaceae bacterium]|nr:hypothetical protein [Fimbriimonadaceae bacterium]
MTTVQDIKTELVLRAPRAKVWEAITTPEGWTGWFSDHVEGDFQVGETLILDFGNFGKCCGIVVDRKEFERFAYKWHPGEDCAIDKYPESEMTTVAFELRDHPLGSHLTLIESGFENLPENRRVSALHLNSDGWKWELAELQVFVELDQRQAMSRDEIRRERVYPTTADALWNLVATPEGLKRSWVKDVLGELAVGTVATLVFEYQGKDIHGPIKVTKLDRPRILAYLSHPNALECKRWEDLPEDEATLTTFSIEEVEGGAHLTIIESGFDRVPELRRTAAKLGNSEGWSQVMDMIGAAVG